MGSVMAQLIKKSLNNKTEDQQIYICSISPSSIRYIEYPSEKVQKAAIVADPESFIWIKNPCPEVLLIQQKYEMYRILTQNL